MNTCIAFFRGINVGGRNVLPMKELVALLEGVGCEEVRTYIQSGNAVFRHSESDAVMLVKRIEDAVLDSHGFRPRILILSANELRRAIESNPYPEAESDPSKLHLYFLSESPSAPDIDSLNDVKIDSESFDLIGKVFYLHAPNGIGRSKLAERVERHLGVDATARNWRTVSKVFDIAKEYD